MKKPPASHKRRHTRQALRFDKAQMGDVDVQSVAGRDLYAGIDADVVVGLLQESVADEKHNRRMVVTALEQLRTAIETGDDHLVKVVMLTGCFLGLLIFGLALVLALVLVSR